MSCCKSNHGCGCQGAVPFPISYAPPAYPMGHGGYPDHRGCSPCGFNGGGWGFGGIWIIIIILLLCCGGCGFNDKDRDRDCGCDDGFDNGFGSWWIIIIILLLCFCGGSGFGF